MGDLDVDVSADLRDDSGSGISGVRFGRDQRSIAFIRNRPFSIDFHRDGDSHVTFSHRGFFNIEPWRPKPESHEEQEALKADESIWLEESYGRNTDPRPRGPESIALGISFPGFEQVFGYSSIPVHSHCAKLGTNPSSEP